MSHIYFMEQKEIGIIIYYPRLVLFLLISNIYLINAIKDKEIEKISKSKYKYSLIFLCITLLISSIILSQSRVILIVLLVYLVFILTISINIKNKIMIFNTILFSLIYSNIFTNKYLLYFSISFKNTNKIK